jgi:hypothetical protein
MPARSSSAGLRVARTASRAYSLRKIAEPRPRGIAISEAQTVTEIVPTMSGMTPNEAWRKSGAHSVPVM